MEGNKNIFLSARDRGDTKRWGQMARSSRRLRAWVQGGKRSAVICIVKAGSLMVQRWKAEDRRQKSKEKGLPASDTDSDYMKNEAEEPVNPSNLETSLIRDFPWNQHFVGSFVLFSNLTMYQNPLERFKKIYSFTGSIATKGWIPGLYSMQFISFSFEIRWWGIKRRWPKDDHFSMSIFLHYHLSQLPPWTPMPHVL